MKNADMKIIAVILSIALLFTIVTSNAVSIASVVILYNQNNAEPVEGEEPSGSTNTGTGTSNTGATTSNTGAPTPNVDAATPDAGTATPDAGTATPDAGAAADPVDAKALSLFQNAAKDIHENGSASYNKIGWQTPLKIEGLGFLDSIIVPILEGFMTTEDEAEVKANAKGSDDAKNRMPASNCSKGAVKSATIKELGNGNYEVVIVLAEQTNPSYADTDGLAVMSREFLDYKDVEKEAANISIVKSLEGEIKYVDYTITAEMTPDGKFVSITHYGIGYIKANLNGSINASGELEFNAKYTDFQY